MLPIRIAKGVDLVEEFLKQDIIDIANPLAEMIVRNDKWEVGDWTEASAMYDEINEAIKCQSI